MSIQVGEVRNLLAVGIMLLFSSQCIAGFLQDDMKKQRSSVVIQPPSIMYPCLEPKVSGAGGLWHDCGVGTRPHVDYWSIALFNMQPVDSSLRRFAAISSPRHFEKKQLKHSQLRPVKKPQALNARVVEPGVIALVAIGLVGLIMQRRRQR